ncbi:MAG: hypothetical protein AAFQ80_19010 [Cyanobacteria bacterium J06621_8]
MGYSCAIAYVFKLEFFQAIAIIIRKYLRRVMRLEAIGQLIEMTINAQC